MAEVLLLDISGRTCWKQRYAISAGVNVLPMEGLEKLHNGVYLLQYNDGGGTRNIRLLIQH
jgi:hypothetical protein